MNLILLSLNLLSSTALIANTWMTAIRESTQTIPLITGKSQPKLIFDKLLEIPPTVVQDIVALSNNTPPIKLQTPTNVKVPTVEEVKSKLDYAISSDCIFQYLTNWKCDLLCSDFQVEKVFQDHYYGSVAVIGTNLKTKEIIISHRGSVNLQNWMRDFSYELVQFPGAKQGTLVHKGFLGVYNSNSVNLNSYFFKMLENPKYKNFKVIFTGHSLGAAVATIQAVDLGNKLNEKNVSFELFSYHSPRVGNKEFRELAVSLHFTIARYTNQGDLVSQNFPRKLGYVHLPGEFHTHKGERGDKVMTCSQEWDEDPNCGWSSLNNIELVDHVIAFNKPINFFC